MYVSLPSLLLGRQADVWPGNHFQETQGSTPCSVHSQPHPVHNIHVHLLPHPVNNIHVHLQPHSVHNILCKLTTSSCT